MREPVIGGLVTARAGRDRGGKFLIVGYDGEAYVMIADGAARRMGKPKKKKLMHVHIEPACAEAVRLKLEKGEAVQDAEIRKAIAELTDKRRENQEG